MGGVLAQTVVGFRPPTRSSSVLTAEEELMVWDVWLLQEEEVQEDAREIQQGKPYHWKDWSIIRGRDCLYIWSDAAALELSNGSNGWFRFILDGKLATMYSSGSPEGGSDSSGSSSSSGPSRRTSADGC